jgi:hypothetical protein
MCAVDLGFYTTQGCRLSPMQFESLRAFGFCTSVHGTEFAFGGQHPSVAWVFDDLYSELFVLFLFMKQVLLFV